MSHVIIIIIIIIIIDIIIIIIDVIKIKILLIYIANNFRSIEITENKDNFFVANTEFGLQVNAEKIEYILKSCEQNTRQNLTIRIANVFFFKWDNFLIS